MTDETYPDAPNEVYTSEANYIRIDIKATTANRLVGWLREFANYCEVAGNTKTGDHARHIADRLAHQLDEEAADA